MQEKPRNALSEPSIDFDRDQSSARRAKGQNPTAALFLWARLMKYNEKLSPHVRGLLLEENYLCISAGRWGCPI